MEEDPTTLRTSKGKRGPAYTGSRGVVINRVKSTGPGIMSNRMSLPGGYTQRSVRMSTGPVIGSSMEFAEKGAAEIGGLLQSRNKEKGDIQGLNRKLATYIENCKMLDVKCKALAEQLEIERKKKGVDFTEIKETYEQEIKCLRKCIDELEKDKAESSPKIARLEDEVNDLQEACDKAEANFQEYVKKLQRSNDEYGAMRGDLEALRKNLAVRDDQILKLNDKIKRLEQELTDQRLSLEEETRLRLERELEDTDRFEELTLCNHVLEAENNEYKRLLNNDSSTVDMNRLLDGAMNNFVASLQEDNDQMIDNIKKEYAAKYESKMQTLQAAQNRENLEMMKMQSELNKFKSKNSEMGPKLAEYEALLRQLKEQIKDLQRQLQDEEKDHDEKQRSKDETIIDLEATLKAYQAQLTDIMDTKMNLEAEIYTYRKLLDGEEQSMRHTLDQNLGARSDGANQLADLVNQSSGGFSSESFTIGGGGGGGSKSVEISETSEQLEETNTTKQPESPEKSKTVATLIKEIETSTGLSKSEAETSTEVQQENLSDVSTEVEKSDATQEQYISKKNEPPSVKNCKDNDEDISSLADSAKSQIPEPNKEKPQSPDVNPITTGTPEDIDQNSMSQSQTTDQNEDKDQVKQNEQTESEIDGNRSTLILNNKKNDEVISKAEYIAGEPEHSKISDLVADRNLNEQSKTGHTSENESSINIDNTSVLLDNSTKKHEVESQEVSQVNDTEVASSNKPETLSQSNHTNKSTLNESENLPEINNTEVEKANKPEESQETKGTKDMSSSKPEVPTNANNAGVVNPNQSTMSTDANGTENLDSSQPDIQLVSKPEVSGKVEKAQLNGIESPTKLQGSSVASKTENELTPNDIKETSNGIDTLSNKEGINACHV